MPDNNNKIEIIRESGTHYTVKLPVEGHNLIVLVDKENFTITIPYFEFMNVESIVKVIVQLYKDNSDNPVLNKFFTFLQQPENKEELQNLQSVFRATR